ncbi:MAG: tetratricopeptide repeat protein [Francisellaceae bacterium]|nr:tetratricopeptide repeat protein [Francisellaceae bacterium]
MALNFNDYINSGIKAIQQKDYLKALNQFNQALISDPFDSIVHNYLGNTYKYLKQFNKAYKHYQESLRLNPNSEITYNNLANLFFVQADMKPAIFYYEKALNLNPDFLEAHLNLANANSKLDNFEKALTHYEMVLKQAPRHYNANFHAGLIYFNYKSYDKSISCLEKCHEIAPTESVFYYLANAYLELGALEKSQHYFENLLELNNQHAEAHHNLAIIHLRNSNSTKALHHFKLALTLNPSNQIADHMLNALQGNTAHSPPTQHIKALFDQYAEYYDEHLKLTLNYQVPTLLRNALGQCLSKAYSIGTVVDLGCGTGISGLYCRDLAYYLFGVDISPKMLEKAKRLGAYDKLVEKDVIEFLEENEKNYFDIILAADLLSYMADLNNLFELIAKVLKPNAYFAFTVEALIKNPLVYESFKLLSSGRFCHSREYLHKLCQQYHFTVLKEDEVMLRLQENKPLMGYLFVVQANHII